MITTAEIIKDLKERKKALKQQIKESKDEDNFLDDPIGLHEDEAKLELIDELLVSYKKK